MTNEMDILKGHVRKFGDDINTDLIAPGRYMSLPIDEMKKHVFEPIRPDFNREIKKGDIIVGGNNFGCGSSREEAPAVLKACGIAAIVAVSFARIFYRNAIAIGLPVLTCPEVADTFEEGDIIELNIDMSQVTGTDKNIKLQCEPLSDDIRKIIAVGGIVPMLKKIGSS